METGTDNNDFFTYKIVQEIELNILGKKVIDTVSGITWRVTPIKQDRNSVAVCIETTNIEQIKANESYKQLTDFIKQFNVVTNKLVLQLGKNVTPIEVLNKQEILDKWMLLKYNLLRSDDSKELDAMIQKGTEEFADPIAIVKKTLLYKMFFPPLYAGAQTAKEFTLIDENQETASQLFQGEKVIYSLSGKITRADDNVLQFVQTAKNNKAMLEAFKKLYNKIYKEALNNSHCNYAWNYEADYEFDKKGGVLNTCRATMKEFVNPQLEYITHYKITLQQNEKI